MIKFFKKISHSEKGATAVEYGLILAFIALAAIVAVNGVANSTIDMWNTVANRVVEVS